MTERLSGAQGKRGSLSSGNSLFAERTKLAAVVIVGLGILGTLVQSLVGAWAPDNLVAIFEIAELGPKIAGGMQVACTSRLTADGTRRYRQGSE